jgi:hypothetical protein
MTSIIGDFITRVDVSNLPPPTKTMLQSIGGVVKVTGGPVYNTSSF